MFPKFEGEAQSRRSSPLGYPSRERRPVGSCTEKPPMRMLLSPADTAGRWRGAWRGCIRHVYALITSSRSLMQPLVRQPALRRTLLCPLCTVMVTHSACDSATHATDRGGLLSELARSGVARAIEPRLSLPMQYHPCSLRSPAEGTIPRAECAAAPAEIASTRGDIINIAARASAAVHSQLDPEALHAAALIDLLWADSAGNPLERSISYLQTASRLTEHPAPVLADLAAAYLVRAERRQTPRDLLEAIEAAERALELEPRNEAARFNLALALNRLALDGQAAEAWSQYLMLDSTSGWATEARHRSKVLAEVHEPPPAPSSGASASEIAAYVARAPQEARLLGWDRLLGEWGEAVLEGDSARAADRLHLAAALGETLERQGGDATLADAVRAIRAAAPDPAKKCGLARGHRAYAGGRAAFQATNYADAERSLTSARAAAHGSRSLHIWATLAGTAIFIRTGQPEAAAAALRELSSRVDTARDPVVTAHIHWMLGTSAAWKGRYEEASAHFHSAAELFARAGETEHQSAMLYHKATQTYLLGDAVTLHAGMHQAATLLRPYRSSMWLHNTIYIWAQAAAEQALPRAAVRLQHEGVVVAARTGSIMFLTEARLGRARLATVAGRLEEATEDIDAARGLLAQVHPGTPRDWMSADLSLAEGGLQMNLHPERAAAVLDRAVNFFASPRNPVRLLPALIARAEARLRLGEAGAAEQDLERAIALLDEQREVITSVPFRARVLDAARDLIDRLVLLRVASGQPAEALAYLERGRLSFASVGPRPGSPNRLSAPQGILSARPGEVAMVHALIGDTLLTWIIADTVFRFTLVTLDREALLRSIARANFALELRADEAAAKSALADLYDLLIRPLTPFLGAPETPIAWIADGEIAAVPLTALYDRFRKRYLVQDHPVRFASSLQDAQTVRTIEGTSRAQALLIADPAFNSRAFPGLERLPGAVQEVEAIAAAYPNADVLAGPAVDRRALENAFTQATIVHFAGHAIFDDERPERSHLVLAPPHASDSDQATISAAEIERLDMRQVRIVVLSACQTARTQPSRSGGFAGLAGALLAAGAGGVVGSLWRVEDRLTQVLMVEFHQVYRDSGDGAGALREAQLRLLRSHDPTLRSPAAWAGFRYVGN